MDYFHGRQCLFSLPAVLAFRKFIIYNLCRKEQSMATSKGYLDYVLEQLSGLPEITHRAMMGEYVLYYRGKVIGGIYDDRLLLKTTKAGENILQDAERDIPYEGAKEMFLVDVDDRDLLTQLIEAMYTELPEPKKRRKYTES